MGTMVKLIRISLEKQFKAALSSSSVRDWSLCLREDFSEMQLGWIEVFPSVAALSRLWDWRLD